MKQSFYDDKEIFQRYVQDVRMYDILPPEEQLALVIKAQAGDEEARNLLISSNLRFVMGIIKRYRHGGLSMPELISEGNLGLFRAIEKFDPTRQNNFISYAVWWIRYYVMRAIQQSGNSIRMPANKTRELLQIRKIEEQNHHDNIVDAREATKRVSEAMNMSEQDIVRLKSISRDVSSLNREIDFGDDGKVTNEDILEDAHAENPHDFVLHGEEAEALEYCLAHIPAREADIVKKRYGLGGAKPCSLGELSEAYGLTKERIRQLEIRGIHRMRAIARNLGMVSQAA